MAKVFVVGFIDWFDHTLILERIVAASWQDAVRLHSKFPWCVEDFALPSEFAAYMSEILDTPDSFQRACFDVDSMMNFIEVNNG